VPMKILLVDDHVVVRAGVHRLLATEVDATILEAESSGQALDVCQRENPDLIILDLNLTGSSGFDLLRRLLQLDKTIKVLVLSMHSEPIYAARALQAGARGYVSKSAGAEELVDAVRQVGGGGRYIEREIATVLAVGKFSKRDPFDQLTTRELDIMRLLAAGQSYAQIAATIGVSYKTVANSSSMIREKLSVRTTADLIRLSIESRRKQ
jgi:two-component system, NarL family, invasion response regulator UvrY